VSKTTPLSDARIVESWHQNASPWTEAVRSREIRSRNLVTDRAIVDAILQRSPGSVLDLGCGEGWLARELSRHSIRVIGVDVVPGLIERAQNAGGGEFRVVSYEDISGGALDLSVDAVVCNFSLLGKESVEGIFATVPRMLHEGGFFIVQTVHPVVACGDLPYEDGWRMGSWEGFSADFTNPAPWYFRTVETWKNLFSTSGLTLLETREPVHPDTRAPASILFIGEARHGMP
jgi:SAM-dependent methyltransferase